MASKTESTQDLSGGHDISRRLSKSVKKIMDTWVQQVRVKVPAARDQESGMLESSLPAILQKLVDELSSTTSLEEQSLPELAEEHGRMRAELSSYSLNQVIVEYQILRRVITDILLESGALTHNDRESIQKFIDQRVVEASESFLERKLEGEQLARSRAESGAEGLKIEQELREQFIYTLTHDLRTPLAGAKMCAQLIARRLDQPDVLLRLSSRINDDLDRISQMIKDLLDFSRVQAGQKLPLEIAHVNLRSITSEILEDLSLIYGNRFVLTNGNIEGFWCAKSLRRAFENLLNNAVKYGCPKTPISILLRERGTEVEISVHNVGDPIAPEQQKSLFKPYCRSKIAEKSGKVGWGIGLSLVFGVAEAHGGWVKVESSAGDGTTFTIVLPKDARHFIK